MININGIDLWFNNGNYYIKSLDSDVGVIVCIEKLLGM